MENNRWGVIYCPKRGVWRTHRTWEKIQRLLKERGVEYDFVQSENRGSVQRLTTMLINNGYRHLVIVGGDTALNQVVNGLMSLPAEQTHDVTLGIVPNGVGNDFAHFWDIPSDNVERAVDILIRHRVRRIDVGLCRAIPKSHAEGEIQDQITRYFLNCVNVGLVAHILNLRHRAYRFWGLQSLSHVTSFLLLLFHRMENRMRFTINHEHIDRSVMTLCIGNCQGYGQTPNAVPYNGMLDVSVVSQPEVLKLISGMWMLMSGKFLNNKSVKPYRTASTIKIEDLGGARVSADGKAWKQSIQRLEVSVLKERINFVIP